MSDLIASEQLKVAIKLLHYAKNPLKPTTDSNDPADKASRALYFCPKTSNGPNCCALCWQILLKHLTVVNRVVRTWGATTCFTRHFVFIQRPCSIIFPIH